MIKDTFHEFLRVVHAHPIESNKEPDGGRLFFDFMLGQVIQNLRHRLWTNTVGSAKAAQIFLVPRSFDTPWFESNKLKAKTHQTIRLRFHHGGGGLLSGVETKQDTTAVAVDNNNNVM
jgi:hypothetical protein